MDVPTNNVLTEEKAWSYFRDIVLGIEYCEYYEKLYPGFLCSLTIIASPSLENMAVVNHLCEIFRRFEIADRKKLHLICI